METVRADVEAVLHALTELDYFLAQNSKAFGRA